MIDVSQDLKNLLEARESAPYIGVEIYSRDTVDISSIASPAKAIALFSDTCFTWETSAGSHEYQAKITDFPSVKSYLDDKQNELEIILSNVERGEKSAARFVLNNKIKGCWIVVRIIFPELKDENWIIWWGKCLRPGRIDGKIVNIRATQEIGNYKTKIPFRTYGIKCPLTPGKGDCLGNIPLSAHTVLYQQQYALYGTMLCPDRTRSTCIKLGNERFFQGQAAIAISGTFSYIDDTDSNQSNTQTKKKKKNIPPLKTESWSTVNQTENTSDTVNLAFGRCQLAGHPITWADTGTEVKAILGFCEGRISAFDFIRCRNQKLKLVTAIQHLGDYGGSGSNVQPDSLFGGFSGYNSRLAYLEIAVTGSLPTEVNSAPLITSVIRGMEIPVPNLDGEYILSQASNNPVYITRFLFTDEKFGRVPTYRMADAINIKTADYCDTLIEDRTQCDTIVLPTNEYNAYNKTYRRYRSASAWTAYHDMSKYNREELVDPIDPIFMNPNINWYIPFSQPPLLPKRNILRQRFTINGALQEDTSLLDFIQSRVLPCFRGWINYNREGKIEIRTRQPADTAYLRADAIAGATRVSITNVKKWLADRKGYLLIGVGKEKSEIRKVTSVQYSTAGNNFPMVSETNGTVTATITSTSGGSTATPAIGYIDIGGTVTANSEIKLTFNNIPDDFYITYVTDGIENLESVTRMITAYLNANPDFNNYFTAYITSGKKRRIYIECEAGFLQLDKPIEYAHSVAEEILRVQMVFENCNELDADTSSSFDNIAIDSFSWNDTGEEEINAYTAKYTSAVDDFHIAKLISRTSWDTIDLEGELNEKELDLRLIDNYWQAAYVTKTVAIEEIDGGLPFVWKTGLSGYMLEMGDVVAVRHDSGDGAIRYVPVWIKDISYELSTFTTNITGRLYLSAAWDEHVQPIDQFLTTTLNPDFVPFTPDAVGTTGGFGDASPRKFPAYPKFEDYRESRFSPDGVDYV